MTIDITDLTGMDRFRARIFKRGPYPNQYVVKYTNDYGLHWKFVVYMDDSVVTFYSKNKAVEMKEKLKSIKDVQKLTSNINF